MVWFRSPAGACYLVVYLVVYRDVYLVVYLVERGPHALGVGRVGLGEVAELTLDDLLRHAPHGSRDRLVQALALILGQ